MSESKRKSGGSVSDAKLRAARENGKLGGRPRKRPSLGELPENLQKLPEDPLEIAEWVREVSCWIALELLNGRGSPGEVEDIKKMLDLALKAIPKERLLKAEELIREGASAPTKANKQRRGAATERRRRGGTFVRG